MRCPSLSLFRSSKPPNNDNDMSNTSSPPAYSAAPSPLPPTTDTKTLPLIIHGRLIHSKSLTHLEILPNATIGIDAHGTIKFLSTSSNFNYTTSLTTHDPSFTHAHTLTLSPTQFLFPGLIDTHMHAPQYPNLSLGMEGTLDEWCENYTDPIEASYSDTAKAKRVYGEMVKRLLENGTTTVAYNSSIHEEATEVLVDTCRRMGQRGVVGKLVIERGATHGNWESVGQGVEGTRGVLGYCKEDGEEGLVSACVQPRAGSYVGPELMKALGELAVGMGGRMRVQAHMCETPTEVENMHKVHEGFQSYADMYDRYGLLGEGTILAHCIHLEERDLVVMKERGVGVAHNANSNTCLRDGWCRVRTLLDRGIKVGLGTDCSAGYSISILNAMRQASNVSRALAMHTGEEKWVLKFEELCYLATMGGAEVCTLGDKVGNFEVGKTFDALVVDTGLDDNINTSGFEDDDMALLKKWVFMGDDRSIRKVFVGGKLVAGKDLKS